MTWARLRFSDMKRLDLASIVIAEMGSLLVGVGGLEDQKFQTRNAMGIFAESLETFGARNGLPP